MRNVRVFFEKKELAKYISHLDLMRCFSRAVKRSGVNIWYTEGYNPHAFMTFSLPLSLGTESYCESVDMRIIDEMSDEEIMTRLNSALPDSINITNVGEPIFKAEDIAFSEFQIVFNALKNEKVKAELEKRLESGEIIAEKKSKQGRKKVMKQINLKNNIKSYSLTVLNDKVVMDIILTAGNKNNINPSLLIDAVSEDIKDDIDSISITKKKMFTADMTEFK